MTVSPDVAEPNILPYNGDIQKAMAARDREAIRKIMAARTAQRQLSHGAKQNVPKTHGESLLQKYCESRGMDYHESWIRIQNMALDAGLSIKDKSRCALCRELSNRAQGTKQHSLPESRKLYLIRTVAQINDEIMLSPDMWPTSMYDPIQQSVMCNPVKVPYLDEPGAIHLEAASVQGIINSGRTPRDPNTRRRLDIHNAQPDKEFQAAIRHYAMSHYGIHICTGPSLRAAVVNGDFAAVHRLLEQCVPQARDEQGNSPLCLAAERGDVQMCKLLMEYGATQQGNGNGETPLFFAAVRGHVDVCRLLLDQGATYVANKQGRTPLSVAAELGRANVCRLLLERGATHDADSEGETPLHWAVMDESEDTCKVLLDGHARHTRNKQGQTPLWIAAEIGNVDLCRLLLNYNSPLVPNNNGETPLWIAAKNGHVEICRMLLGAGATQIAENSQGITPLLIATSRNHLEVCRVLLEHGATFDADEEGMTPLYSAAADGNVELVKLLLTYGADRLKKYDGMTPSEIAEKEGHSNVVAVLAMLPFRIKRGFTHSFL